ncbi:DUF3861 domain-containing protein [Piscinibacter sakaiensis]|uniref:DUF3861 domain-containing protein n=1 Tax=Piscinibacter sakaiensis TaxID=1547922 RepID=A0A0K8P2G1_PISS1|nr:hypothetical protein ISF6_2702 [Piscinibacter sakaiensis]
MTVEHLALPDGSPPPATQPLSFETGNHDDILAIAARMRQRGDLPEADATALAVGLKLFSEVMLQHRGLPLFADFAPHFKTFMQALKRGPAAAQTQP